MTESGSWKSLIGKASWKEGLVHAVLWTIMFAFPIVVEFIRSTSTSGLSFSWTDVFRVWTTIGEAFVVWVIHNFWLAPLLVYKHKYSQYFCGLFAVIVLFALLQCSFRPSQPRGGIPNTPPPASVKGRTPMPPELREKMGRPGFSDNIRPDMKPDGEPPLIFGQKDLVGLILLLLVLGTNLAIMFYFKSSKDTVRLEQLEKRELEQQLEYLKQQISPHFFMNTLNNIHALVDIDPEKAKTSILELSRLMRFGLYEGAKPTVPLRSEIEFLNNYLRLMRLRFSDKVRIDITVDEPLPEIEVPPLLCITYVENAFKHGISYKHDSFIDVHIGTKDNSLLFECRNSRHNDESASNDGGVGMRNARQRLDLIYGDQYSLKTQESDKEYYVELKINIL